MLTSRQLNAHAEAAASSIIERLNVYLTGMDPTLDIDGYMQSNELDHTPDDKHMWRNARNLAELINTHAGSGLLNLQEIIEAHTALFSECGPDANNGEPTGGWRKVNVYLRNASGQVITMPPPDEVPGLMQEWHNTDHDINTWYGAGAAHYAFEHIHPFPDGNGRIGRLIVSAMRPAGTVISDLLFHNLEEYYGTLNKKSAKQHACLWERLGAEADHRGGLKVSENDVGATLEAATDMLGPCIVYDSQSFCGKCNIITRKKMESFLRNYEEMFS